MSIITSFKESIAGWQMAGSYAFSNVRAKAGEATDIAARELAETVIGLRYGATLALGKAQTLSGKISEKMLTTQRGVEKSVVDVTTKIGESFGNIGESFGETIGNIGDFFKSAKYQMLIPVIILAFIAVMVAIGYSGLGAPTARIAEREHARRR